jgi:hypothetical protein
MLALILTSFSDTATQEQRRIEPGQRVRVTAPVADLDNARATVMLLRDDAIVLRHERFRVDTHGRRSMDTLVTEVPISAVTRLAVHVGKKSGWKTGMLVGGASMFFVGLAVNSSYYSSGEEGYARYVIGGAVFSGLIGAGIGSLIGSAIKTDRWQEVPLDRLRVSVVPTRNGFGLGARIAF